MILSGILTCSNQERTILHFRYLQNFDGGYTITKLRSIHEPIVVICQNLKNNQKDEVSMQQILSDKDMVQYAPLVQKLQYTKHYSGILNDYKNCYTQV